MAQLISICPGGFLELAELIDFHLAVGEDGFDLQVASHGSNHRSQSMDWRVLMYISARRSILETAAWLMAWRDARPRGRS